MGKRHVYKLIGEAKTKVLNISASLILVVMSLGGALPPLLISQTAHADSVATVCSYAGCTYPDISSAVSAASANEVIDVSSDQTVTATININQPLTIESSDGATITTTGSNYVFSVNSGANGTKITGLNFVKADTTSDDAMVYVAANNVSIQSNNFSGQYQTSADATTRGIVLSGVTGVDISGNHFNNLRQPAYINDASGTVSDNFTAHTRGWVVVSESSITFTGNTWGTGADQNAVDIAIVQDYGVNSIPITTDNYLPSLMSISDSNNNAVIEDQLPSPRVMTDVYVDANASTIGENGYPANPYTTITPAISRVVDGGRIHVAAGTYNEGVTVNKSVTIDGAQAGIAAADTTSGTERSGDESTVSSFNITASNVVIDGFSLSNPGVQVNVTSSTTLSGIQVKNNIFSGYGSVGMPTSNAGNLVIANNFFTNPASSGEPIQIKANSDLGGCDNTQVTGNVFTNATNNGGADVNFSCTGSDSSNVTVSGNLESGNSGGSSFTSFSGVTDGIHVTNNKVTGSNGSAVFFWGGVTGSADISGNTITGGAGNAISIQNMGSAYGGNSSGAFTITGNDLSGNKQALSLGDAFDPSASVTLSDNNLSGNSAYAVNNGSASLTVNATSNWWGSATPDFSTLTYGNVNHSPWWGANYVGDGHNSAWTWYTDGSIQSAVNAATAGDTINVLAGTYNENVNVNKDVTVNGAGSTTTGTVISPTSGNALTIAASGANSASPLTLQNLRVTTNNAYGVAFDSTVSHVTLNNVVATNNNYGIEVHNNGVVSDLSLTNVSATGNSVGFRVATTGSVNGLTVSNSAFDNNTQQGWYIAANSASTTNQNDFTNISVANTTFNNNTLKGFYAEKLDNATFDGITVNNSGTSGAFSSGFNINEKYGSYSNITITDSSVTNSGTGDTTNGTGYDIEARDDGGYASNPAALTNVTINGGAVTGDQVGIRFGETGKNNAGPTNVTVSGVNLSGNIAGAINNQTQAAVTATHNWWGLASPSFTTLISGSGSVNHDPWFTNSAMTTLSNATVIPDGSGNATVTSSTPQVVVTSSTQPVTVTVAAGTSNAGVNFSSLVSGNTGTIPQTTINSSSASVSIPASTTVTATGGTWNGVITAPTVQSDTSVTIPTASGNTTKVGTVIEVGAGNISLTFDQAVKLTIPGQAGQLVGFVRNGDFTQITNGCSADSQAAGDALPAGGDCYINVGNDMVVWTKHFTQFVTYNTAPTTAPTKSNSGAQSNTTSSPTNSNGYVLADSTTTPSSNPGSSTSNNAQVKGNSVTTPNNSTNSKTEPKKSHNFLGLGWWWLLVLAAVVALIWAVLRSSNSNDTKPKN